MTTSAAKTNTNTKPLPFQGGHCYACDSRATGFRDRRPEGGQIERACDRHRDTAIKTYDACTYCNGPLRRGSVEIEGYFAHISCVQAEAD